MPRSVPPPRVERDAAPGRPSRSSPARGELVGVERAGEEARSSTCRSGSTTKHARRAPCSLQDHGRPRRRGTATTNRPPHSRTSAICSMISSRRFHGQDEHVVGPVVDARRSGAWIGRCDCRAAAGPACAGCGRRRRRCRSAVTPAVVEQRVALGGGAVGRRPRGPRPGASARKSTQAVAAALDPRRRSRRSRPGRSRPGRALGAPARRPTAGVGRAGRRPAAAQMRRLPPWVGSSSTSNTRSPWRASTAAGGEQREVGEVLVVDRVELRVARSGAGGAAPRCVSDAVGRERRRQARRRSRSRSGTWARTLLATTRSARRPSRDAIRGGRSRRRTRPRWARRASTATSATFAAGSTPSTGTPASTKCCSR